MKENIMNNWLNGRNLFTFIIGLLIAFFAVSSVIDQRFSDLEDKTRSLISEQETLIVAIAEATSRNGADEVTERIITNCSIEERGAFNSLLDRLNSGLSPEELDDLDRLFARCGSFNSERKALMSARLTREVEVYDDYIQQLNIITEQDYSQDYNLSSWQELADREAKQSELFSQLVDLQDKIISELRAGKSASSPEIEAVLLEVNNVQDSLAVATAQASELRKSLTAF